MGQFSVKIYGATGSVLNANQQTLGKTEGNIASALNIKVTKVRSAVQHLEKYGFDVMRGERRDTFAASQGRATQVPRVRLGDLA